MHCPSERAPAFGAASLALAVTLVGGCSLSVLDPRRPDAGGTDAGLACPTLLPRPAIPIPSAPNTGAVLLPWRGARALLVTSTAPPVVFEVDPSRTSSSTVRPLDPAAVQIPADFVPSAAFVRGEDFWLGGADGTLAHAAFPSRTASAADDVPTPSEPLRFARVSTRSAGQPLGAIDGAGGIDRFEVYAVGSYYELTNRLYRFDPSGVRILWERTRPHAMSPDKSGAAVVYVGPGEAYAVSAFSTCNSVLHCVLHVDRTGVWEEAAPDGLTVTSVALDPAGGAPLAGTAAGQVLMRTGSASATASVASWSERFSLADTLGPPTLSTLLRTIVPIPGGLVAFSNRYGFVQRDPGSPCSEPAPVYLGREPAPRESDLRSVVTVSSGFILSGDPEGDDHTADVVLVDLRGR
jgi:hypothetical protein